MAVLALGFLSQVFSLRRNDGTVSAKDMTVLFLRFRQRYDIEDGVGAPFFSSFFISRSQLYRST